MKGEEQVACASCARESAFNYRKVTSKTAKTDINFVSIFCLGKREKKQTNEVYSFCIRSGCLLTDVLICVQCSVGSSFLCLLPWKFGLGEW